MKKGYFLGDYNALENEKLKLPKKVTLFDTSLRDGEQMPGVSFTDPEKLKIADLLDRLGIDCIEAGFPINSKPEFEIVKEINKQGYKSHIYGLARALMQTLLPIAAQGQGHVTVLSNPDGAEMTRATAWSGEAPVALMSEVKKQFDPKNILNPGRFVFA